MNILIELIKRLIERKDRKEDWVDLVPRLSFSHRGEMVEDIGEKESVSLTIVLENHGRSLARVSSIELIIRAMAEGATKKDTQWKELPVEILSLKGDELKEGVLEIKGKEPDSIELSDRDLRQLVNDQYGRSPRKLNFFKNSAKELGIEIAVKSNMDSKKRQKVSPFSGSELSSTARMLDLALKER
ncbi:hypothetical protein [Corynebacterium tuberculostearicum]|uniref:hypothetical protein n=1 Tax=Corynebacterium tuberculostearicum TaxID=38304 RepID=UPI00254B2E95|nr:hypothetical protein [Corynebacterium tuberculostearicum]MDK8677429.1 hypothetical protein [Corynebacterium tuberculostearicum]